MSKKIKSKGKAIEAKKSLSEEIDASAPTKITIMLRDDDTKAEVRSSISLMSSNQRVIYKQIGFLVRDLLNKLWPLEIESFSTTTKVEGEKDGKGKKEKRS